MPSGRTITGNVRDLPDIYQKFLTILVTDPLWYYKTAVQLNNLLIEKTPGGVYSIGTAKNNWFVTVGSGTDQSVDETRGQNPPPRINNLNPSQVADKDIFMSNNVDYITALEFNHSPYTGGEGILFPAFRDLEKWLDENIQNLIDEGF